MTYDYQQSLIALREFNQKIDALVNYCNEEGQIAPDDIQKISTSLKFLSDVTLEYEKKGLVDQKVSWNQRTRLQKFYANISQVFSQHLGHILGELKGHKYITDEEYENWIDHSALPVVKQSPESKYVTGWRICYNMSRKSTDFIGILWQTRFLKGSELLKEGFTNEQILLLTDPEQHTSYGTFRNNRK